MVWSYGCEVYCLPLRTDRRLKGSARCKSAQERLGPLVHHTAPTEVRQVAPAPGRDALPVEPTNMRQHLAVWRFVSVNRIIWTGPSRAIVLASA